MEAPVVSMSIDDKRGSARFVRLLLRSGELLGESLDYHETLQNVCAAAVETIADICLLDILDDKGDVSMVAAAHRRSDLSAILTQAGKYLYSEPGYAPHVVLEVIGSHEPVLVGHIDDKYLTTHATSLEHAHFMRTMGFRSMIVVPLISRRYGVLGALTIVRTDPDEPPYERDALEFVVDLGRRCATAMSKSMLYEQTLDIATRFQRAALPKHLPKIPGFTLDAYYEPASTEQLVGGDWYDAFDLESGCYAVTIGDVQGHGIEAAVLMSSLRDALRAALYGNRDLAEVLRIGDVVMSAEGEGAFATALIGLVDPEERTLSLASAGHPGPLLWKAMTQTIIDPFLGRSLPLGLQHGLGGSQRAPETIQLEPGDFAAFFTDGLVEWGRDAVEGERRLAAAMRREEIRSAAEPALAVRLAAVEGPALDDVAILTLCVEAE